MTVPLAVLLILLLTAGRDGAENAKRKAERHAQPRYQESASGRPSEVFRFQGGVARLVFEPLGRASPILLVHCDSVRCREIADSQLIVPRNAAPPERRRLLVADDPRHDTLVDEATVSRAGPAMLSFESQGRLHLIRGFRP